LLCMTAKLAAKCSDGSKCEELALSISCPLYPRLRPKSAPCQKPTSVRIPVSDGKPLKKTGRVLIQTRVCGNLTIEVAFQNVSDLLIAGPLTHDLKCCKVDDRG
jgi:hypothetical protein